MQIQKAARPIKKDDPALKPLNNAPSLYRKSYVDPHQHQDTRPIHLNSFLLNGGYIYHIDGFRISFEPDSNYFVIQKGVDRYTFETLESCACFLAFSNTERTISGKRSGATTRTEWFVLDLNEVYAAYPRKKEAIRCCYRLNEDKRVSKSIYRLENGLYEYTGPAHYESKHFYIGLRPTLMKNGFEGILKKWDQQTAQFIENEKKRAQEDILNYSRGDAV